MPSESATTIRSATIVVTEVPAVSTSPTRSTCWRRLERFSTIARRWSSVIATPQSTQSTVVDGDFPAVAVPGASGRPGVVKAAPLAWAAASGARTAAASNRVPASPPIPHGTHTDLLPVWTRLVVSEAMALQTPSRKGRATHREVEPASVSGSQGVFGERRRPTRRRRGDILSSPGSLQLADASWRRPPRCSRPLPGDSSSPASRGARLPSPVDPRSASPESTLTGPSSAR